MNNNNLIQTGATAESGFSFLSEFSVSRKRLRMLGITHKQLARIDSLDALKALAKEQYHKVSQWLHPDTKMRRKHRVPVQRPPGQTFQSATDAYHWISGLTERDVTRWEHQSGRKYLYRDGKFHGSVSLLGTAPYDCPLPWHYDRHVDTGYGWQQSFDHVKYQ